MGKEERGEQTGGRVAGAAGSAFCSLSPSPRLHSSSRAGKKKKKRGHARVLEEEGAKEDTTKDDDDFDKRDKLHRFFIVGLDPRLGRGAMRLKVSVSV